MNYHPRSELKNQALSALPERSDATLACSGTRKPRILMCAPDHFGVDYVINPWMEDQVGQADGSRARAQWECLRQSLLEKIDLVFVAPEPGLPDMVFTANAGLALDGKVAVSRFHAPERQGEEPLFRDWFERQGYEVAPWPEDMPFEGAGDALPDRERSLIWCGFGWRSSAHAPKLLEEIFDRQAVGLKLVDPRFYHLDTCLCPLSDGWLMYHPPAFDAASQEMIRALTPAHKRIEVMEEDALFFACNAVEVDGAVFMNHCSPQLRARLGEAGFTPMVTPLSEFLKAGGAAKCLTLEVAGER